MRKTKHKYLLALACASVFMAISMLPFEHRIYNEYPSVYWQNGNPEFDGQSGTVLFDGILTPEQYTGKIKISFSEDIMLDDVDVSLSDGVGMLTNTEFNNGIPDLNVIGLLICNDTLTQFSILLFDPSDSRWDSLTTKVISAPANTRDEALNVTRTLSEQNEMYSQVPWT